MTTEIIAGSLTITPDVVDGFESTRPAGNLVHPILGRTDPDVTLRPAGARSGRLRLVFASETESRDAELAHVAGIVCQLVSDDRATVQMSYVVAEGGEIRRELADETRDAWILEFDYQEVPAP